MVLVLCEPADLPALWAADRLQRRGLAVSIVTGSGVTNAIRWEHRLATDGTPSGDLHLANGCVLSGTEPCGVLNRLTTAPVDRLRAVGGADSDYAVQEMSALFISWLASLPGPMVNRPSTQGLAGHWRHPAAWAVLAARAGLATPVYRRPDDQSPEDAAIPLLYRSNGHQPRQWLPPVFVVGDDVVSSRPVPPEVADGCRRLAELSGDTLLGCDFTANWELVNASATPDLRSGGEPLADALASALAP